MNIYYEMVGWEDNNPVYPQFWVEENCSSNYMNYKFMMLADRVWIEERNTVTLIKNRSNETLDTDTEYFDQIKLKAKNLKMMAIRKHPDGIYVSFPPSAAKFAEFDIPDGVEDWLNKNTTPGWEMIGDERAGVYLFREDAIAFKIRWMS